MRAETPLLRPRKTVYFLRPLAAMRNPTAKFFLFGSLLRSARSIFVLSRYFLCGRRIWSYSSHFMDMSRRLRTDLRLAFWVSWLFVALWGSTCEFSFLFPWWPQRQRCRVSLALHESVYPRFFSVHLSVAGIATQIFWSSSDGSPQW